MKSESSESTPLQGSNNNTASRSSPSALFNNIFQNKDNWENAANVAQSRLQDVQKAVQDGNFSLRLLALLGGLALVISSVLGILQRVLTLNIFSALIELYTLVGGIIILVLESRQLHLPERFLYNLYKYALFLKFVWGRGCLYFVLGTLQFVQGDLLDIAVGASVMFIGGLYIYSGQQAAEKLQDVRKNLFSEQTLRSKFQEADREGDGNLTKEEFQGLVSGLGVDLNRREIEAAYMHLSQASGSLTFDRFREWWAEGGEPNLSV